MSERMYPGMSPEEKTSFTPYSAFDIPADLRELHGRYDVEATARRVRNFRYAEEWTMMILGGWVATIPEIPVKTGLGKIIWEASLSADELGKRLPELRWAARPSTPPSRRIKASRTSSRPWPSRSAPISPSRRSPGSSTC